MDKLDGKKNRSECDSHADTTAAGSNTVMIEDISDVHDYVDVAPFSESYQPIKNIPIATAATAYDNPDTGETTLILFGQSLFFGDKMASTLICPNQIRENGNVVDDCPRQYNKDSKHGLTLRDHESKAEKFIPFEMDGVISYLSTRKPSKHEIETCPRFWATSEAKWDPHDSKFEEDEKAMNDAFPRRDLKSVRMEVETVSDDDSSEMNVELQDASKQTLGEDLHLRWLQSMAQPRNLSAIGIAEDGMLLDRMIRCRNLSDLSRGDRFTINPNFQDEMDECYDTFETKDCETEQTITSIHLGDTVRQVNAIHTPLQERVAPNGTDVSEIATTLEVINISAVHRHYRGINLPKKKAVSFDDRVSFKLPEQGVVWLGTNHGTIPLTDSSKSGTILKGTGTKRSRWGPKVSKLEVSEKRTSMDAAMLAKSWRIGLKSAKETLKVTTQRGIRRPSGSLHRRFSTQPWRQKPKLKGKFFSDTMHFSVVNAERSEKCAQVTTNGRGFSDFFPIQTKFQCSDGLVHFINRYGVMDHLVVDGAKEEGAYNTWKTPWQKVVKKYMIRQTWIQPYCWWQNAAEREIGEIRRDIKFYTQRKGSPKRLWGFLGCYVCGKRSRTALSIPSNMGRTGFEIVTGQTPDITLYACFDWYDWVFYKDEKDNTEKLGRNLGPAEDFGAGDCFFILTGKATTYVTNTMIKLSEDDYKDRDTIKRMERFDAVIDSKIGDKVKKAADMFADYPEPGDLFADDGEEVIMEEPEASMPEVDDFTPEELDEYIGAHVLLPVGSEVLRAVVKRRTHDDDGRPIGLKNPNPMLDTREYELQLPDGSTEVYSANIIAENIFSQMDDEGNLFTLMKEIVDHRTNKHAVKGPDGWHTTKTGQKRRKPTTKGWELLCGWKDGTSSWVKLTDLKESFPIELAEYAHNNKIIDEPAFAWWAYYVLKKRDRIIMKAKTKYWQKTHKYGVELPKTIEEAYEIDRKTNTTHWRDAIKKEMKNVMVAFEFDDEDKVPIAHQRIGVHMVFDVRITLDRKARLVADGHKVPELPKQSTYSTVPTRDSIRLFFLLAALNDLDVLSADIQNAYLTAPISEKYYVQTGMEFPDSLRNRPAKVVRALYGLPVAGSSFRSFLAKNLKELGYESTKGDADVYMRPAVKKNGEKYYEYLVAYVDDILCCGEDPRFMMECIEKRFTLKNGTIKEPDLYLGADIEKVFFHNCEDDSTKARWALSSTSYTTKAIEEVERELKKSHLKLPAKVVTPLSSGYRPELDSTRELSASEQNYYQGLIGILRWICELGRLDIIVPISLMSRYLAQAREGHLQQLYHVFAYLKTYASSKLVFDDTRPDYSGVDFHPCDWREFYPDAGEVIPPNMPEARGKPVMMSCFVDADHAGCKETRRSHTGVILFINKAPILWFSKRQNTVETSTFGSEIVAMRIAIELIEGMRYKLRMMGVPIDGECSLFCDNESVVKNVSRPESPCKKKHNSVAYHKAREGIAARIIRVAKEDGLTNIADILTKLCPGPRLRELVGMCMWR